MQQNTFIPPRVHSYLFLPLQLTLSLLYTHTQLASSPALVSSHPRVRSRYSRRPARAKNLPARIPSRARSLLDSLSCSGKYAGRDVPECVQHAARVAPRNRLNYRLFFATALSRKSCSSSRMRAATVVRSSVYDRSGKRDTLAAVQ